MVRMDCRTSASCAFDPLLKAVLTVAQCAAHMHRCTRAHTRTGTHDTQAHAHTHTSSMCTTTHQPAYSPKRARKTSWMLPCSFGVSALPRSAGR